jgi:signal transduction histidine kinase
MAAILAVAPAAALAGPASPPDAAGFEGRVDAAKTAMMGDPQAALARSTEALQVARAHADTQQAVRVATAQWLQGEALYRLSRLDEAAAVIDQALAVVATKATNTKLHADLLMAKAGVMGARGQVQPALQGFQAAYKIFGKVGEPRSQAKALMFIGSIYQDARDYGKVLQYYAQAAELYPADTVLLVTADNNIANALRSQKRYPESVAAFEKARLIAKEMGSTELQAEILTNQAVAEIEWGRLDAAQGHINASLRLLQGDPGARDELPAIWAVAARIQLERHQPQAAAQLLDRAFAGMDLETTPLPFRDFHETAYRTFTQLGDEHKALAHLRAFKRLDDQARELAASTNAALISAQFDFANQSSRIAQLKAGQLQRDVELGRQRNVITTVLLFGSILVTALLLVSFLWIRRSRNQVRATNGLLNQANGLLEKALRARTEFLANTSHEIRTPLNGILGMTQVILGNQKLDPDVREKIGVVHAGAETMRALVDDILDIAALETDSVTLNRDEFDLPKLCKETVQLWTEKASAKGLALKLDASAAPGRIIEDSGRLRQILFNLMSNAIKFTDKGSVSLTVEMEVAEFGEQIIFVVTDTGIGIPHDKLEEVFESFRQVDSSTTRTYEGTGLGLAICQKLARAMGGDIYVDSALGRGTTVTARLPLERGAASVEDEGGAEVPRTLEDCRLLICDANPLSQAVIKAVLQPQARAVEAVGSCDAARAAAESGRFDLVLIDVMALGEERQARLASLRVLSAAVAPAAVAILTPDIGEDEAGRLLHAGAAQIIKKPIAAPALAGELRAGLTARADDPGVAQAVSAG